MYSELFYKSSAAPPPSDSCFSLIILITRWSKKEFKVFVSFLTDDDGNIITITTNYKKYTNYVQLLDMARRCKHITERNLFFMLPISFKLHLEKCSVGYNKKTLKNKTKKEIPLYDDNLIKQKKCIISGGKHWKFVTFKVS